MDRESGENLFITGPVLRHTTKVGTITCSNGGDNTARLIYSRYVSNYNPRKFLSTLPEFQRKFLTDKFHNEYWEIFALFLPPLYNGSHQEIIRIDTSSSENNWLLIKYTLNDLAKRKINWGDYNDPSKMNTNLCYDGKNLIRFDETFHPDLPLMSAKKNNRLIYIDFNTLETTFTETVYGILAGNQGLIRDGEIKHISFNMLVDETTWDHELLVRFLMNRIEHPYGEGKTKRTNINSQ